MCFLLNEQWRAYKNLDGKRKKQKALPMMVLRKMLDLSDSHWETAVSWLLIGAIFFAMRSCEYLETNTKEEYRRTKILRLKNIAFKKNGGIVQHNDPDLADSDLVIVTFEFQKNTKRDVQVHMFRTTDSVLNPVKAFAETVSRIRSYPGSTDDTKICTILRSNGQIEEIKSNQVRDRLKTIVELIGGEVLGFTKEDIGLHSVRSGGAMAMFLSGTSTIIIQRIGRWSSEAFLEYIREQVESFTAGVSQNMINFEHFFNLNLIATQTAVETDNKSGPEFVPFQVQFSQLALNNDSSTVTRRDIDN
mmetsp:Transcript_28648/g.33301  ORF Transcript_28648/g.33301 Transcript_28648/m.33301 type:complete len:304 (-) Transcript_28648:414-1325(-)